MPNYKITPTQRGLHIQVSDAAGKEQQLLEALQECQEGRCSCPTAEYEKLAHMQVTRTDDSVEIDLRTKPGVALEADAVQRCLDFTVARLDKTV